MLESRAMAMVTACCQSVALSGGESLGRSQGALEFGLHVGIGDAGLRGGSAWARLAGLMDGYVVPSGFDKTSRDR